MVEGQTGAKGLTKSKEETKRERERETAKGGGVEVQD